MTNVQPLLPPEHGQLSYLHVSHCTFALAAEGTLLLIDPFFSGSFWWKDRLEKHLDSPACAIEQFQQCDAILVSHEHEDHFDVQALRTLMQQTPAVLYAPQLVVDLALQANLPADRIKAAKPGESFDVGPMRVTPYPAAGSEKTNPVDRIGFLIQHEGQMLYHQGDSHAASSTWAPMRDKLDVLIMWPHRVMEVVNTLHPRAIVFHHLDRFTPGDFFCNRDAKLELTYHRHYHPDTRFIVPPRGQWQLVRDNETSD